MLAYHNSLGKPATPSLLRNPVRGLSATINRGNVSVTAERHHLSMIVYAVPVERVRPLLPDLFCAQEAIINGRPMTWVMVESFFDQSVLGQPAFEQTEYSLCVTRNGQPSRFLLGASLGSLSAVGIRNLWPMPWHLSAMEFRVAYNKAKGKYREYSLQSQSQWANAIWTISDTGQPLASDRLDQTILPPSLFSHDYLTHFTGRDGHVGARRTVRFNFSFTRGELKTAQCDLLERLGLLNVVSREEMLRPALVALQHRAQCQLYSPVILPEPQRADVELSVLAYVS